ncbi:hypothetical protein Lalb_Chr06g0162031 [Lupinus albus]|uniref:Uncharacterized protein n=1 Tax=Lupinus albus TaxID=3870 RepID=A0A6A4QAY0_LUPAL|nr:hypothetical protein Lalb_Chr06g0162031 [Lupinus albus]
MSSEGDEDELLQMALKEQSQRDVNYTKSSSTTRKPVANYVKPPQIKRATAPTKGRVVDDDDDSEVEMLSISSGDEDNVKDSVTTSKNRARSASRDDDRVWDGEEPSSWKYVDEAEVCCHCLLGFIYVTRKHIRRYSIYTVVPLIFELTLFSSIHSF